MTPRTPRIEIICVGSELFNSRINSHTVAIGQALARIGMSVTREHVVGDDAKVMTETFADTFRRSDIVICAGGLGPTFDDFTRDVWARVVKRPLLLSRELVADIENKFKARQLYMPPQNKRQARVLKGARVLANPFGTAPGQLLRIRQKILVLMPGPTRELVPMLENFVLPELKSSFSGLYLEQKSFHIFGFAESKIDQIVRPWVAAHRREQGCQIEHGILASNAIITVKFKVTGRDKSTVHEVSDRLSLQIRRLLKEKIFGEDNQSFETIVAELLRRQKKTLSVAESCTGGLISKLLTDIAGASEFLLEGVVTYHNDSKKLRLGVSEKTLRSYGAVSRQTAVEMADGIRRGLKSDIGLSVTGIAGPAGGTSEKPVGLVWIGLATRERTRAFKFQFNGERAVIRQRAAQNALNLLRLSLQHGR